MASFEPVRLTAFAFIKILLVLPVNADESRDHMEAELDADVFHEGGTLTLSWRLNFMPFSAIIRSHHHPSTKEDVKCLPKPHTRSAPDDNDSFSC